MGADEERTVEDLKAHQSIILPLVSESEGRVIDTAGDGLLAEFPSTLNAVKCAIAIQEGVAGRNVAVSADRAMQFRIGINQGDVVLDENRIYGDGINVAARLEAIAEPGGICISGKVFEEVRDRLGVTFEDWGERQLKNIARPTRVFAWRPAAQSPVKVPSHAAHQLSLTDAPSIAVLPFQNMSGDPEQDYFADGIVEDITTALSQLRWLFVIARNSSFTYKGRSVDVKQVGRELGVRYVLEGSARKSGNRVRITGQLIEAALATHVWAEKFDGDLADIFDLQDRITESIVGAIEPSLLSAEIARAEHKPTASLDAYDLYLRAFALYGSMSRSTIRTAISLLEAAIAIDPNYARAEAVACLCHGDLVQQRWDEPGDFVAADRLARQALDVSFQ
jgi:TolB-like protein